MITSTFTLTMWSQSLRWLGQVLWQPKRLTHISLLTKMDSAKGEDLDLFSKTWIWVDQLYNRRGVFSIICQQWRRFEQFVFYFCSQQSHSTNNSAVEEKVMSNYSHSVKNIHLSGSGFLVPINLEFNSQIFHGCKSGCSSILA